MVWWNFTTSKNPSATCCAADVDRTRRPVPKLCASLSAGLPEVQRLYRMRLRTGSSIWRSKNGRSKGSPAARARCRARARAPRGPRRSAPFTLGDLYDPQAQVVVASDDVRQVQRGSRGCEGAPPSGRDWTDRLTSCGRKQCVRAGRRIRPTERPERFLTVVACAFGTFADLEPSNVPCFRRETPAASQQPAPQPTRPLSRLLCPSSVCFGP